MAVTQVQMAEIARILGYPNLSPMSSLQVGYPYFSSQLAMWQPYAMLLNRLSQAAPYDEVQYFGAESPLFDSFFAPASVSLTFSMTGTVATGTVVQLKADGGTFSYTTEVGDTPASIAKTFASLIAESAETAAQFLPNAIGAQLSLYNIAAIGTDGNGVQCIATSSDPSLSIAFGQQTPGQFAHASTCGGQVPPGPQFRHKEEEVVFGYVPIIHILEGDLIAARRNLDTLAADQWRPRQDELSVRYALLHRYRKELANRLSVPVDPDLVGNDQRIAQRVI